MRLHDFDYDLPGHLIAQTPSINREDSRLMVLFREEEKIIHSQFKYLSEFVNQNEIIVLNESKVIPARLFGHKQKTGARIEILISRPLDEKAGIYKVLAKPMKRISCGTHIEFATGFEMEVLEKNNEFCTIKFNNPEKFEWFLNRYGKTPLPPYITKRNPDDKDRYQTIFARIPGSVAAPTAGLHFTVQLFNELENKNITIAKVILHVGPGTFMPLREEKIENQSLEEEEYSLPEETANKINNTRQAGNALIAVGTTTTRVLESCADIHGKVEGNAGLTSAFIYPGYKFRVVDKIITNFHLPRSSLLLLVCAFAGKDFILNAYKAAISMGYRFYSYGDAMLIR
ncbi:MAG: tRNA preQ1(34) S-adenosylmethionine ribosyltransferase-isomerase QueA [Candidatus Schekmanbacteria bacterium RBG_13_48_7]|uniref:S-adenosylmethionine:tRNA ribosyltransferase-isomerase n=1 Tax=Candidatus Schekmanbacteria bacterium RBG_13_48_7 TaxID=1817878 RepID=A0A1F7RQM9_9BACT|nr:MAG: tRNA preQ1(34) S-adenosylmethionine ribosyltransferase-isomerase QueA [Candidatus Schekmanbacteria bacterium RBG_13_48_7]